MSGTRFEARREGYLVSDDPALLDFDAIYAELSRSYWADTRQRHTQDLANRNSFCLGLYLDGAQVGFARVVTDYATFAYLCDVYVTADHQGQGLGRWLMECLHGHPRLQGLRRWSLATRDAHGLYAKFGWVSHANPGRWMEKFDHLANPPLNAHPGQERAIHGPQFPEKPG